MKKKTIQFEGHHLNVQVYENAGKPQILLLHGFPDNTHLYDLLVPYLVHDFEVITFDFLGWGASDKPKDYPYSSNSQKNELDAVINALQIEHPILVAHDASGPPAIDWAIEHESKIKQLILLNTYYSKMPTLRAPEAIWLFSTPVVRNIARFVSRLGNHYIFHKMYYWQVGKFMNDAQTREKFVPLLNEQFKGENTTQSAFFQLNKDLRSTIKRGTKQLDLLRSFEKEVTIIFGAADKYLNKEMAKEFADIFPNSNLHLIDGAKHFVQLDAPDQVATVIINGVR